MKKHYFISLLTGVLLTSSMMTYAQEKVVAGVKYNDKEASANIVPSGHDSCEKAVFVDVNTEEDGIRAEHLWSQAHHPDAQWNDQALVQCPNFPADKITLDVPNGTMVIYFDISKFLGHM
jgi:hypothetical protein